jgi:hypothetical protein
MGGAIRDDPVDERIQGRHWWWKRISREDLKTLR